MNIISQPSNFCIFNVSIISSVMRQKDNILDKSGEKAFHKKVVSVTQHLRAYVNHRLYIAESLGIIPKNMYSSTDLIDEAIVKYYDKGYDVDADPLTIKLKLFKIVDTDLDELYKTEAFHKNTLSTNDILHEELDGLIENYTIDDDFDFIMKEELSDISYRQDTKHKHVFVYDDNNTSLAQAFEIENLKSLSHTNLLGRFYTSTPLKVTDIVDLFVFGRLNYDDIAKIKNTEKEYIEKLLTQAMETLKSNLG